MLARRIIPCLDVVGGRVVKGIQFLQLRDAGDPVEQAAAYDAQGADELCFLDIGAAPEGRATLLDVVARTADRVFAPLTVGGGVRRVDDAERLLDAGADKIAINSAALAEPGLVDAIAARFGCQALVVAIDARRRGDGAVDDRGAADAGWDVYSHGGRTLQAREAVAWAREVAARGAGEVLVTSMDRDGTGAGYDTALVAAIAGAVSIPVVASGGVGTLDHLVDGLRAGADAVLAASIFHFGQHTITDARRHLAAAGLPVRPPR
ncbi:MAG: imidazole glycerol phosphate synthase subunit HisF [Kofleriaceae bacterium]|nr:imidazole glycerol phosphate synthase subunit HisF [Kofleriaceae bacterium]MBP6838680.1 imidazole glycerol phosphate synthase subunit HisF [Kofleriaceae bacterium]MBP9202329.1 imidazole glycerol phosphate synthase subunit HisF [Kofleriaceae bacterium]